MNNDQQPAQSLPLPTADESRNIDAVIAALAAPVLERLDPAAGRLQPLSTAAIAELDCAIGLQLAQRIAALRGQYAALHAAAAADQAMLAVIDLPMALRRNVQAARGARTGDTA